MATKQALNANTVTLISGTIGGTYVQFGADLASVLDDGNKLRVLPIIGRGWMARERHLISWLNCGCRGGQN